MTININEEHPQNCKTSGKVLYKYMTKFKDAHDKHFWLKYKEEKNGFISPVRNDWASMFHSNFCASRLIKCSDKAQPLIFINIYYFLYFFLYRFLLKLALCNWILHLQMNKNKYKIVIWHLYERWSKISYEVCGFDWNDAHCWHRFAYIYSNCHWVWVHMNTQSIRIYSAENMVFFFCIVIVRYYSNGVFLCARVICKMCVVAFIVQILVLLVFVYFCWERCGTYIPSAYWKYVYGPDSL